MADGPTHYRAAEKLLARAEQINEELANIGPDDPMRGMARNAGLAILVSFAQVHATLALAAASAQNIRRNGALEGGTDEWAEVLRGAE